MGLRILAVDDEPDILLLLAVNIRSWGHHCLTATTAREAIELCAQQRPDVLLLDVSMPRLDGAALLTELRRRGVAPARVVLISAKPVSELEDLARSLDAGYLSKPFSPSQLLESLAAPADPPAR